MIPSVAPIFNSLILNSKPILGRGEVDSTAQRFASANKFNDQLMTSSKADFFGLPCHIQDLAFYLGPAP